MKRAILLFVVVAAYLSPVQSERHRAPLVTRHVDGEPALVATKTMPAWYDPAKFFPLTGVERASWDFLYEASPWSMVHMLMPFTIMMCFQHTLAVICVFTLWETFERVQLYICDGHYCTFSSDESAEHVDDSLVGDIFQGIFGLLLARLFIAAVLMPRWNFGLRMSRRIGLTGLWFKRLALWLSLNACMLPISRVYYRAPGSTEWVHVGLIVDGAVPEGADIFRYGVLCAWVSYSLVLLGFYFWNKTETEKLAFWLCYKNTVVQQAPSLCDQMRRERNDIAYRQKLLKTFRRGAYARTFICWWVVASLIILSAVYSFTNSVIVQTLFAAAASVLFLFIVAAAAKSKLRFVRILDTCTCGIVSLCTGKAKHYGNFYGHNRYYTRNSYDYI